MSENILHEVIRLLFEEFDLLKSLIKTLLNIDATGVYTDVD